MARMRSTSPRIALVTLLALVLGLGADVAMAPSAGAESAATVHAFGGAPSLGAPNSALNAPIVGIAPTRTGRGYWLVASDGGIFSFGNARFYGSTGATVLYSTIAGMATTPGGRGYWLASGDGRVFPFGDATAMRRVSPTSPIV